MLAENKFSNYLIYALGEIVLVVIGILIALSLNNSNEKKKNREFFLLELDLQFNRALYVNSLNDGNIRVETDEIQWIDSLLNHSDAIALETLPKLLYRLNSYSLPSLDELIDFSLKGDVYSHINIDQQLLINDINIYLKRFTSLDEELQKYREKNDFGELLMKWGLPRIDTPNRDPTAPYITNVEIKTFYTPHHYDILKKKIGSQEFYDALISLRSFKSSLVNLLNQIKNRVTQFQVRIAKYYPPVGTSVLSLGILGSSLPEGWSHSVPLEYDDKTKLWTVTIELKEGMVKFRANDTWDRNWGGITFPQGNLAGNGANIKVEPGVYLLTVDLINNTYEFVKIKK